MWHKVELKASFESARSSIVDKFLKPPRHTPFWGRLEGEAKYKGMALEARANIHFPAIGTGKFPVPGNDNDMFNLNGLRGKIKVKVRKREIIPTSTRFKSSLK